VAQSAIQAGHPVVQVRGAPPFSLPVRKKSRTPAPGGAAPKPDSGGPGAGGGCASGRGSGSLHEKRSEDAVRGSPRQSETVPEESLELPYPGVFFPPGRRLKRPSPPCLRVVAPPRVRRWQNPHPPGTRSGTPLAPDTNPCRYEPLRVRARPTPPPRTRCPGPASSAPSGRASRSDGSAHASDRAPCRPRSACARGRRRCRTAS